MAKIFLKSNKNQTFSTLGHHRGDDDLVLKMFGFYLFNMLAHLNLGKLYGQHSWISFSLKMIRNEFFLFTFHSKHLKVHTYTPQLFFKISGGEKRGRWRTWEQMYTNLFKIQCLTLHRKDNNRYTCAKQQIIVMLKLNSLSSPL